MQEIIIAHQYYTPEHFLALYHAKDRYHIKKYIILDWVALICRTLDIIRGGAFLKGIKTFLIDSYNRLTFCFVHDKLVIVGLAPYDKLMIKFGKVFFRNRTIYFTSWDKWDGSSFPQGSIKYKSGYEKSVEKNFKAIACVSQACYDNVCLMWKDIPKNKVMHAIEVEQYQKKKLSVEAGKIKKFCFIGNFCDRKNIGLILDYFMANKREDIEIFFIGDGDWRDRIAEAGVKDRRIRYCGRWTKEQIKEGLHYFDYVILPSHYEPFGIILLEALACGVPSIVSDTSGPSEIITDGETGFIFPIDSPTEFSHAMDRAIELDGDEYQKLVVNAVRESEAYSCEAVLKNWEKLFDLV